jgi:hypothetical protein
MFEGGKKKGRRYAKKRRPREREENQFLDRVPSDHHTERVDKKIGKK